MTSGIWTVAMNFIAFGTFSGVCTVYTVHNVYYTLHLFNFCQNNPAFKAMVDHGGS